MASETWQAKPEGNGLVLSFGRIGGPISRANALTLMSELSAYCAGGGETPAMSASKVATAATPSGKGPRKKTGARK